MNLTGMKELETERLVLEKFKEEYAQQMFNNWASDKKVTKFLIWQPYTSADDVLEYIKSVISSYDKNKAYDWMIKLKETNEVIGTIGVVKSNFEIGCVTIGYCIGSKWWHKGIMTEALGGVIKFFFEEVGVNRIESTHDVNNPNSGKVMENCNMVQEGILRQAGLNNQGIADECCHAILKEDYFANSKA